jgi:hypothetical protein
VHAPDGVGLRGVGQEQPRADDVVEPGAELVEGGGDDLEAPARLGLDVGRAGPVGPHRRGAGHDHPVADADGAAEPDGRLVR